MILSAILPTVALSLPATAPSVTPPPTAEIPNVAEHQIVVIHDENLPVRDRLRHAMDVWHDAGRFLVGEASTQTIRWIDELPVDLFFLTDYPADAELYVIEFTSEDTLDQVESAGGKILFRYAPQALDVISNYERQ